MPQSLKWGTFFSAEKDDNFMLWLQHAFPSAIIMELSINKRSSPRECHMENLKYKYTDYSKTRKIIFSGIPDNLRTMVMEADNWPRYDVGMQNPGFRGREITGMHIVSPWKVLHSWGFYSKRGKPRHQLFSGLADQY